MATKMEHTRRVRHIRHIRKQLEKLKAIKRKSYHALVHQIHKKHKISKKTLFYVKEYGPRSNVPRTIIKESIRIMLLASIISSLGGLAIENIKTIFISITPLIILLPSLNGMIGDFGAIVSSRFSAMLHEGKIKRDWWKNTELKRLFAQVLIVSLIAVALTCVAALLFSNWSAYKATSTTVTKIFLIAVIDVILLVLLLFLTSIFAGFYVYRKKEDPNNFLIPITTSIADFGNMIILSVLVTALF
ncbi:MAG: magnesium transporter [Nanoarchaeota archaeon]